MPPLVFAAAFDMPADAALAEQGKYKELYEQSVAERDALKAKADAAEAYEQRITAQNTARIQALPEKMRKLVPADYAPAKLSAWLDDNAENLTSAPLPALDAGKQGGAGKPPPDPNTILKRTSY